MKNRFARPITTTLILVSALVTFGCKAPLQDKPGAMNMATTAQKKTLEDVVPAKVEPKAEKDATETPAKEPDAKKRILLKKVEMPPEKPRKSIQIE